MVLPGVFLLLVMVRAGAKVLSNLCNAPARPILAALTCMADYAGRLADNGGAGAVDAVRCNHNS